MRHEAGDPAFGSWLEGLELVGTSPMFQIVAPTHFAKSTVIGRWGVMLRDLLGKEFGIAGREALRMCLRRGQLQRSS